ncbi:DUF6049 family protein [Cumulibacter manganitolerans]|uniref:DUF6049 family protein n=1 Tax=Cumulibacter manganitolerans TaxID=1884992 RepID=UPI00129521AB|nr:DUF6049 family protein [Cumulibacter manganitolerans]
MSGPARRPLPNLLIALFAALLAVGAQPGFADPTSGPPRKEPLPVKVTITTIAPTVSKGDEPVQVTAEVTNNGDRAITDMWARLQRDKRVVDRAGLLALDKRQPAYASAIGPNTDLGITLEPGQTRTIQLSAARSALGITDAGSYPIMLNLQGAIGGTEGRVGQAAFTLPRSPVAPAARLQVGWVLPLIDRPHRSRSATVFTDDDLRPLIETGGRLENILAAAETYGAAAQVTLVVDPELVDELSAMAAGYQVKGKGGPTTGPGKAVAAAFLERLTKLAETTPIVSTAYADIDVVATVRAGLGGLLKQARQRGAEVVKQVLGVPPVTTVAWPADGIVTETALGVLRDDQVSDVLLGGASFGQEDYLASEDDVTESAATALPGIRATVADPALTRILGQGSQYAGGPAAATEQLAAELMAILAQAPNRARTVLLLPPRQWQVSADLADRLMTLTTTAPWLQPVPLDDVVSGQPQDRGPLQYPSTMSTQELPASALAQLQGPITQVGELGTAFDPGADRQEVLGPIEEIIFRGASSAWRGDGKQVTAGALDAGAALDDVRDQIRIVTPNNGSYTLSSSDAPLVLTVENNLAVPVHFRIGLDPRQSSGLSPADIGVQSIPARSRATIKLPTKVERSGTFSVVAQISTPEGKPLGKDVMVKVSSSAYGTVALLVTGVAFTLLLALIARRWWRRRQFQAQERARESGRLQGGEPPLDGAALPEAGHLPEDGRRPDAEHLPDDELHHTPGTKDETP